MTHKEAVKIYDDISSSICFTDTKKIVILDGVFVIEQIEAILIIMKGSK